MIEVQIRSKRKKDGKLSYGYSFEIANIDGIQTRLGHSDIKITIDVYEHTTDTMRSRGREAINSLFS